MTDPLDDVRRALGLPTASPYLPQEAGAAGAGEGSAATRFDGATQAHEAMAKAHEQERTRLAAAGDDADGLDELRRAFRRAGRG